MQDYRKPKVWQKAHQMTLETYAVCQTFPRTQMGVLRDQLFRAALSVPSNIAEGAGRGTDRDFRRFLLHALGSLNEVEYDLLLARDLRVLPVTEHLRLCRLLEEVRRMLSGLVAQLKA